MPFPPVGLEAYFAEIHGIEDEWYSRYSGNGRIIGTSLWNGRLRELAEIDNRHGVRTNDPRVYSIQSYKRELDGIEAEWAMLKQVKGWPMPGSNVAESPEFWKAECRFSAKLDDCRARHFPGLDSLHDETADTIPKLWAHITQHLIVVAEFLSNNSGQSQLPGQEVRQVYSRMHRLNISSVPNPPYPTFTESEAIDELYRIANILEQKDAEQSASFFDSRSAGRSVRRPRSGVEGELEFDAFISYRRVMPDQEFARKLVRDLEDAGFKVAIDECNFQPNAMFLDELERCIKNSRFTLAVVSPRYFQSGNCEQEAKIRKVIDMAEQTLRLIPLIIEPATMPTWMYGITGINFSDADSLVNPLDKLKKVLTLTAPIPA